MAQLSGRYAAALFDLALESGALASYREQAAFLSDTLQNDDCRRVIEHPHISGAGKKEFLSALFAGKVSDDLLGFLYLGVDKSREKFLVPGLRAFIARADEFTGRVDATALCAAPLDENQILALEKLLSQKLQKRVIVSVRVDPSVLGGVCIQADGYFLDMTVKKRLSDMKASLQRSTADDFKA